MEYRQTPIIQIKNQLLEERGVELLIKREDLNHPYVSGNKWWKLKYNLEEAINQGHNTLLTFGGAYSNHIYATAAAAHESGLKSIGIIRGEETMPLNATLSFVKRIGMKLHYMSREIYRTKDDPNFNQKLIDQFGKFYLIPEGGTNVFAIKGCEEWADILNNESDFDYLCLPVGTGGTIAGMINVLNNKKIIGFSSLRGGAFLEDETRRRVNHKRDNWRIETEYHFGGYGKVKKELVDFIFEFERTYQIPLDPVYTAKMMYGIFELIKAGRFKHQSKILALHTGGLQGRAGFNF
ncbi:pyridoxal-phosphate dependent enzyme [Flammeovirgaceae bacterium]